MSWSAIVSDDWLLLWTEHAVLKKFTHVYTLVERKSNRNGFLIVGLRPLDYSIDSRITCMFTVNQIGIGFCVLCMLVIFSAAVIRENEKRQFN